RRRDDRAAGRSGPARADRDCRRRADRVVHDRGRNGAVRRPVRAAARGGVPLSDVLVLCYHAVSPTWGASLSVTPDEFESQLRTLLRRGWRGATFRDAVLRPPWPRTLAVTFDDAFLSVLELAHPILARLGLPATVF